jgi:hypothetical protein
MLRAMILGELMPRVTGFIVIWPETVAWNGSKIEASRYPMGGSLASVAATIGG